MTRWFVILTSLLAVLPTLLRAQSSQKRDAGPRALALLELSPDGTGHLVPVAIMYNGDFFDASAYKADPVPMALDSGTVYEAMHTGASQGLFTVKDAVQTGSNWTARGKWQDSAALAAAAAAKKKKVEEKPPTLPDDDKGPPKLLRRSSQSQPAAPAPQPPKTSPPQTKPSSSSPSSQAPAPAQPQTTPSTGVKASTPPAAAPAPAKADSAEVAGEEDPNRPRLERGKPSQQSDSSNAENAGAAGASPKADKKPATLSAKATNLPPSNVQEIPAISDAGGPEARSYLFPMKPGEDQLFHKKMLAQATQVIRAQMKQESAAEENAHHTSRSAAKAKTAAVANLSFQDVQLRVFDLSSSNQPLMVLEATVQVPGRTEPQHITLVSREDINGDLHNALANVSDAKNLDSVAQMDLIDAVDADGDGRGELLFRETSDQGHAYSIYRVIGDQLYQLYESTPQ